MKFLKSKITFKILIGYIVIGVAATFFGGLVLSEIKTFTELQLEDFTDKSKILNVGSLIAEIYENDNLARAAVQLNSSKKFNSYLKENHRLLLKIDSLESFTNNESQEFIFDSIKVVLNKKLKNITDLKKVKSSYNSGESINTVIDKLSSIDSLVNKTYADNIIKSNELLKIQTRKSYRKLKRMQKRNELILTDTLGVDQIRIDSLLSVSKGILEASKKKALSQRSSLLRKERALLSNDLIISRKLRELLTTLKTAIIKQANTVNKQREKTILRSRKIIFYGAIIGILIIIVFSIIFLNDFWKNQRYRKQLERANKTSSSLLKNREQLISMVSHDLRTPLSTITGYTDLLQKTADDIKEKNYIEHIGNASEYMSELVNELMEFSKVESGAVSFKSIPFDLEKNINEIIENSQKLLQDKPVTFMVKHDKYIKFPVIGDPFKFKQIINNLITNACKFTNKGSITIQSKLEYNEGRSVIEISITDTGVGVPKNEQKTIFKPFTQVEGTKENNKKGFGLGLTISKKLAELLKGSLTLKSEEGKGSVFTLKIPLKLSDKPLVALQNPATIPVFNITAIVVEDDASIRQLLSDVFKQHKIKIHVFSDAQQALIAINTISYDLVLTDIQLPKMNGLHFMEVLKSHDSYREQPIIAMTGRLKLSKDDYLNSGFSDVLTKPFQVKELQEMLHRFFDSSELIKEKIETDFKPKETKGFSILSLKKFLEDDEVIRKTLLVFLEDTKKNKLQLKEANHKNDITSFNSISHTMLGMFKQLSVEKITPFLEYFETTTIIDEPGFTAFNNELTLFINSLEDYLS